MELFQHSENRARVAECIARINYSIGLGHFDFRFLGWGVSIPPRPAQRPGLADDNNEICSLLGFAVSLIDDRFPAIMKVAYGGMSPEQAGRALERSVTVECECCRTHAAVEQ
jgi:hypothetical protein